MSNVNHDIAVRAAALLQQGWCQGAMARNAQNLMAQYSSPHATSWCLSGSMLRAEYELGLSMTEDLPAMLRSKLPPTDGSVWPIVYYNDADERTQEEVVAMMQSVAEALR
jgi:hypothetical protein